MRRQRWGRFALVVGAAQLFSCTMAAGPSPPGSAVVLSAADQSLYWREVERRVPTWFRNDGVAPPTLPTADTVYSRVRFLEVPASELETCTFDSRTLLIRVGDDKWHGGCVAHELGHATLYLIGSECWDNFEHPNESPRRCS